MVKGRQKGGREGGKEGGGLEGIRRREGGKEGEMGLENCFMIIIVTEIAAKCGITRHQTANCMSRSLGTGSDLCVL